MKGIIDIPKADTTAPGAGPPRKILDDVLATMDTSSACEAVQVVRIRDPQLLTAAEAGEWKPAAPNVVTLLTSDRKVSKRPSAPEALGAGDFLIALVQATAG